MRFESLYPYAELQNWSIGQKVTVLFISVIELSLLVMHSSDSDYTSI